MIQTDDTNELSEELQHHLTQLLLALGFQAYNLGFNYLKQLIICLYTDPNCSITAGYAAVGKKNNKPSAAVSSAVRNSIRLAYNHSRFALLEKLMGVTIFKSQYDIPAPREAVALINEYLKFFWNGKDTIKDIRSI